MKQILLIIGFILSNSMLYAQITLTAAAYFPNAGDTLKTVRASASSFRNLRITAPSAAAQVWNYTFLRSTPNVINMQIFSDGTGDTAAQRLFPGVDLIGKQNTAQSQTSCYNKTLTRFELMGFKGFNMQSLNLDIHTTFAPYVPERRAPLIYNTGNNNLRYSFLVAFPSSVLPDSLLAALPIRPDSLRVNFATIRTDKVDAWGTMQIPGGSFEVLRERRYTIDETRVEMKTGLLPIWMDITSFLFGTTQGNPSRDTTIGYYFWSNTAKEPIAVVTVNPASDTARSVQFKYFPTTPVETLTSEISIKLYPNPATSELYFEMPYQEVYILIINDALGRPVLSRRIEGRSVVSIQGLPNGMYWGILQRETGEKVATRAFLKQ